MVEFPINSSNWWGLKRIDFKGRECSNFTNEFAESYEMSYFALDALKLHLC